MAVVTLIDAETGATAQILPDLGFNCFSFRAMIHGQPVDVIDAVSIQVEHGMSAAFQQCDIRDISVGRRTRKGRGRLRGLCHTKRTQPGRCRVSHKSFKRVLFLSHLHLLSPVKNVYHEMKHVTESTQKNSLAFAAVFYDMLSLLSVASTFYGQKAKKNRVIGPASTAPGGRGG